MKCDEFNMPLQGCGRFIWLWINNLDMPWFESGTLGVAFECACGRTPIGAPCPNKTSGKGEKSEGSEDCLSSADILV